MTALPALLPGAVVRREDWEGRDLSGASYERVELVDVDLTEITAMGGSWVDCTFRDCRFTGAALVRTALTGCTFSGCDLSGVTATDCKLVGSRFDRCRFDLLLVEGGDWSFTGLPGADLRRARFTGVRMREADLSRARLQASSVREGDLSAALLHRADLSRCDLRGTDLAGLDPLGTTMTGAVVDVQQALVLAVALGLDVRTDER